MVSNLLIGTRKLLNEANISFDEAEASELESQGKTVMFIAVDSIYAGLIAVADTVKDSSATKQFLK